MLAEKERLVASLTAAEKQVTDLASDKEKAIQKLIKRDAKIKDVCTRACLCHCCVVIMNI
jgi:ferredoxin